MLFFEIGGDFHFFYSYFVFVGKFEIKLQTYHPIFKDIFFMHQGRFLEVVSQPIHQNYRFIAMTV